MKCEKCLYRKNCQFLAKYKKADVDGCTAFESEKDMRWRIAREIFADIEKHRRKVQSSDWSGEFWDYAVLLNDIEKLEKKYTED